MLRLLALLCVLLLAASSIAQTEVCVPGGGTTPTVMSFQTKDWGIIPCYDIYASAGSIGGTSFDDSVCIKYDFGYRRKRRPDSVDVAAKASIASFERAVAGALAEIPDHIRNMGAEERRQGTQCSFAGITYPPLPEPTETCSWLDLVPNCNNITIGGVTILTLDSFLEQAMCQFLHDTFLTGTSLCFKNIQGYFCSYIDLSSVPVRIQNTIVTADTGLTVNSEVIPMCNSYCNDFFDDCYDPFFSQVSATLTQFKEESFYPTKRDNFCSLFDQYCAYDCDCSADNPVCVVDATNPALNACMKLCVNGSTANCDSANDVCAASRLSDHPDSQCACSSTYIDDPLTFPAPMPNSNLAYCSHYNGNTCCSPAFEEVLNAFPPVCTVALTETSLDCKNLFLPLDCMSCDPNALAYSRQVAYDNYNSTKLVTLVCRSWIDALWDACSSQRMCPPGHRCLSVSDCTPMTEIITQDNSQWDTQEHFEEWAVKYNGASWVIVDDLADPNAVCWKTAYNESPAPTPSAAPSKGGSSDSGLSNREIGYVAGGVAAFVVVAAALAFGYRRYKKQKYDEVN